MLQFGLRLGARPRQIVTTTPRPIALVKRLLADEQTAVTRARTADNAAALAPAFLSAVVGRYQGTLLGRQELDGELIEARPDALWKREWIETGRIASAPELRRVVVGVDPPAGATRRSDACGIVAAGLDAAGFGYVLADATAAGLTPAQWAARVVALYHRLGAGRIVAEANQGGDMVEAVIRQADPNAAIELVRAKESKWLRSEPVASLYERGRVHHVGSFPELEDELCDFGLDGLSDGHSPDRLDAMVWAIGTLMLRRAGEPRIRALGAF